MSVLLFALSLKPMLMPQDQKLKSIRIGSTTRSVVVAYSDDITRFVTTPENIPVLREAIRTYERATGASLNIRKSKAMAGGSWDTAINMMDIPYCPEITVLGFGFTNSVAQSGNTSWTSTGKGLYGTEKRLK
jgi:hypothetical protein